jgi:hypothetical protein
MIVVGAALAAGGDDRSLREQLPRLVDGDLRAA